MPEKVCDSNLQLNSRPNRLNYHTGKTRADHLPLV